jgi:MYXO-CTERM domain-containing protein
VRGCRSEAQRAAAVTVALAALMVAPAAVRANGAFPDSENILTPADRPQDIVLVTNFGLVSSADGGQTWLWSCEQDRNMLGMLYQLTPLPRNRLFAVANQSVVYSDDRSCGWQVVGGALAGQAITDVYVDPVGGTRVMAIGVVNQVYSLFESNDAGTTFGPALFQAPAGQTLNGVEFARANPNVVYVALRTTEGQSLVGRSDDAGASFTIRDVTAGLGPGLLRIIAIDPQDTNRVLFRFLGGNDQSIALTVDGGATLSKPVTVNGYFNSFVRLASGTILIAGMIEYSTRSGLYRSRDRGSTFEAVPNPPAIRALSERNGTVYAAADNFGDGYALGTSVDEGTTWRPLMAYADVKAINPCLKAKCQETCALEVSLSLWPAEVCAADPPVGPGAGGGGGTGLGGVSGAAGQGGAAATGGSPPPRKKGGCDVAASTGGAAGWWGLALLLAAAGRRRRG